MSTVPTLQLTRTYRFRLKPNRAQAHSLYQFAGARRWVWNWALSRRQEYYAANKATLKTATLGLELTALKHQPDTRWLSCIDSQLLQQPLRDLDSAYAHFYRRVKARTGKVGFPRFKASNPAR